MTIFVCVCGNTKTDQPYSSANRHKWVCGQCKSMEYVSGNVTNIPKPVPIRPRAESGRQQRLKISGR